MPTLLKDRSNVEEAIIVVVVPLLFGLGILLANGIIDKEPKAELPDPEVLLIVITAGFGAGLGALGGRLRDRRAKKERAAQRDERRTEPAAVPADREREREPVA